MPLVSKVCNTPASRRRLVLTSRRRREWSVSGTVCKCPPRYAPDARRKAGRPQAQGQEVAETSSPRQWACKQSRCSRPAEFSTTTAPRKPCSPSTSCRNALRSVMPVQARLRHSLAAFCRNIIGSTMPAQAWSLLSPYDVFPKGAR